VHLTADDGWINDPYGVVWTGDRYHVFYQAIPGRVTWAPNCGWGHAESPDLVRWREHAPALVPQDFELGCWSGSVVADATPPRSFYTRIVGDNWAQGLVATATGDMSLRTWMTGAEDVVVADASDLGVRTFRDPYVFRHGSEWVMIVGAGLSDGSGGAVQYRSSDLRVWVCDGLLAVRPSDRADAVWTGSVWECPQLFPLGDSWVLLVSVWDEDILYYTAAAVGDYDGRRFVPRGWQRLTYGSCSYAMTAFADRDGRRCVMSWLREEPQNDPTLAVRAGAHSVAAVLVHTHDGSLALTPHPDLAALAPQELLPRAVAGETRIPYGVGAVELTFAPSPGQVLHVTDGVAVLAVLEFGETSPELRITRPGRPDGSVPVTGRRELRILLDADLLEVFGAGGYGAFRIGVASQPDDVELVATAPHPELACRIL
jgi:beta-fructofuranosidase